MTDCRIGSKNRIIVCDGGKALFLRNDGDAERLSLTVAAVMERQQPLHVSGVTSISDQLAWIEPMSGTVPPA